jgi:hypothetical protein
MTRPSSRSLPLSWRSLSIATAALLAGCAHRAGPTGDVHEVAGPVQSWPGEAQSSCGDRTTVQRFSDDVGGRADRETRALLTTAQAYHDYFGHDAPAGVDLGQNWVVFYAAGKPAGYTADVAAVGARADVLHVVTTLTGPIPPCAPPPPIPAGGSGGGSAPAATTVVGTLAGTGASTPPAPPVMLRSSWVLVKFPAQATHSVDFQHQDTTPRCGDPQPNPCAATTCPTGQSCVVLETYPPQARCVGGGELPCASSKDCGAGLVCSTELGACGRNPRCGANTPCDSSCWGICQKQPLPPPDRCTSTSSCPSGTRCSTERGDCQGCGGAPGTVCPAICFGVCEPAPSGVCTGGELMGGCRSEQDIKAEAAKLCQSQKLTLTDFAVGNACFASGFAIAKYTCCSQPTPPPVQVCKEDSSCHLVTGACGQAPCTCDARPIGAVEPACAIPAAPECLVDPCGGKRAACVNGQCVVQPQPPPPPACDGFYMGGSACRTYDAWKQAASEACQEKGTTLTDLGTGATCAGGFTEIKYVCCAAKR